MLYDSRGARQVTPASEFQQLLNHSQVIGGGQPRGPVGVAILPRPEILRHGLQLARLAGPLRDIEILLNDAQIEAWLARHAPRRTDPPNDR